MNQENQILSPELEARVHQAVENFMQGYGCCQSVVAALFAPLAEKLVEMKNALAEDIKYHRIRKNLDEGRDYEGEIEALSDGLSSLERRLGENLFVSSDDKNEISAYLRDFYKELAFTGQDTMKLYEG